ncbi:aldolase/citrate lyase family protein [Chitinimonas taiwanensis]|uniref:HpcH/HpaI aldolase/citrate lyase family protein n=1 Tax=Chitinimonas taiwanensis DSM 18899 TaxID=1121279 RepID=A0A1K2HQ62_9NEIS|nr:aldolase/citrate lyase family protein [Chitinimonas taiwanensis]SFZ78895.1 HpcH/HpaI aldolase/citrate lyase family protein [Chitinimonas taiwanensis DSM 18899]
MNINKCSFLFIASSPEVASFAIKNGADRIFLDLEILGKVERQGHLDTVISRHKIEDISLLRPVVPSGSLLVRTNPIHSDIESEVDAAISRGADILMLPMFRTSDEVRRYCRAVNSRAKVCLLVETIDAMENLADCIRVPGVNEVHIGLNDLHLELGYSFMFELLLSGHVERMAKILRENAIPFGIGGVARAGEGLLPADLLLAEHVRLGSTAAILSRTFHRNARSVEEIQQQMDFAEEIRKLRKAYERYRESTIDELELRHGEIRSAITQVVAAIAKRRG